MAAMRPASISPRPMIDDKRAVTPDQKSKHDKVSATSNSGNSYAEKPAPQGALSPSLFDSLQQRASKLKVLLNSLNSSSGTRTSSSIYAEYSLQRSPSPATKHSNLEGAQHGKAAIQECPGLSKGRAIGLGVDSQIVASRLMPQPPQLPNNTHAKPVTGHRVGAMLHSTAAQPSIPTAAPMSGCGPSKDRPGSWSSGSHHPAEAGTSPYRIQSEGGAGPSTGRDAASSSIILRDGLPARAPPSGGGEHTILRHAQPRQPRVPSAAAPQGRLHDASCQRRSNSDGSSTAKGPQPLLPLGPRIAIDSSHPPINGSGDVGPRLADEGLGLSVRPAPNRLKPQATKTSSAMLLPHRPHPPAAPPPAQPYTSGAVLSRSAGGSSDGSGRSMRREPHTPPLASPLPEPALPVQARPFQPPSPIHSHSSAGDAAARGAAPGAIPVPYDNGIVPGMPPRSLSVGGEAYLCQNDPVFDPRSQQAHNLQRLANGQGHGWSGLEAHQQALEDAEQGSSVPEGDALSTRSAAAVSDSSLAYPQSPPPGFVHQVAPPRSQAAEELSAMLSKMAAVAPVGLMVPAVSGPSSPLPCRPPSAAGSNPSGAAGGGVGTAAGSSAGGSGHGSRAESLRGLSVSTPGLGSRGAASEDGGEAGRELSIYKGHGSSGDGSKVGDGVGVYGGSRRRSSGAGSSSAATYDSESALAHALAVARASAIAAFLNPVAHTYRQRSEFSGSSSPAIAPLAPIFSGVPAAAAPFLGGAAEQLPYCSSPRGGGSVVSLGAESAELRSAGLRSESMNSPRSGTNHTGTNYSGTNHSGTNGSQYEKLLRKTASLAPAEQRPRMAASRPVPEFMRRNEVLLRKRQAWAAAKRTKVASEGSPASTRRQQQMQARRAVAAWTAQGNGYPVEGRSQSQSQPPSQPQRSLLDLQRWADWRNKRLEVLREERQAEEMEREKAELTFKPTIGERSRRLAKIVRSRATYTPLPSGASHRSLQTPPSATVSTSAPGCCTTVRAAASSGPLPLSQEGSSEGTAAWSLPSKHTHLPGPSRSSAGGGSTSSVATTTLEGGALMSVDQVVEALETARGGGRHRHKSQDSTAPGVTSGGSYSARYQPLAAAEQLAAARNSRMRGRYASFGGGSPYDDPVMGAVAQAINEAAAALQLRRMPMLEAVAVAVADLSISAEASPREDFLLPLSAEAQPLQSLDPSPRPTMSELGGGYGTAREDDPTTGPAELQGPHPSKSPNAASSKRTARALSSGPSHTQARASARASARGTTPVASKDGRRSARRLHDISGSYAKAYAQGAGMSGGGVAAGFGSDFSAVASTKLHTGRSHDGNPVGFPPGASPSPNSSPRHPVAFTVTRLGAEGQDPGLCRDAATLWEAAAAAAAAAGGGSLVRPDGLVTLVPMLVGSSGSGLGGVDVILGGLPCSPSSSGSIAVGAFRSGSLASSPSSSPYLIVPYDNVHTPPPSSGQSPAPAPRVSTPTASVSSGAAAVMGPFSVIYSSPGGGGGAGGPSGTGAAADGRASAGGGASLTMTTSTFLLTRPSTEVLDPYHTCLSVEAAAAGSKGCSFTSPQTRQPSVVRFSTSSSENVRRGSAGGLPDGPSSQDTQETTPRRSSGVSEGGSAAVEGTTVGGESLYGGLPPHDQSSQGTGGDHGSHAHAAAGSEESLLLSALSNSNTAPAPQPPQPDVGSPSGTANKSSGRSASGGPHGAVSTATGGSHQQALRVAGTATATASRNTAVSERGGPRHASASAGTRGNAVHHPAHASRPRAASAIVAGGPASQGGCPRHSPKRNIAGGMAGSRRGSMGSPVVAPASNNNAYAGVRFTKILSQQFACTASSLAAARAAALSQQHDTEAQDAPLVAAAMAPTGSAPDLTSTMAPQTSGEANRYLALLAALAEKRRHPPPPPSPVSQQQQHQPSASAPSSRQFSGYGGGLSRTPGRMVGNGHVGGVGAEGAAVRDAHAGTGAAGAAGRSHFRLDAISQGLHAATRPFSAPSGPVSGWSADPHGLCQPAANYGQMEQVEDSGKLGQLPQGREMGPLPSSSSHSSPRGKAVSFNLGTSQPRQQLGNGQPVEAPTLFIAFPSSSPTISAAVPLDLSSLMGAAQQQPQVSSQDKAMGAVSDEHHAPVPSSTDPVAAAAAAAVAAAAAAVEHDLLHEQVLPTDMTCTGRRKRRSSEDGCRTDGGKAAKTLTNAVAETVNGGDVTPKDVGAGAPKDSSSAPNHRGREQGQPPPTDNNHPLPNADSPAAQAAAAVASPPPPPSPPPPSTVEDDDDPLAALQALIRRVAHLADDCDMAAAVAKLSSHITAASSRLTSPSLSGNPPTATASAEGDKREAPDLVSQGSSVGQADAVREAALEGSTRNMDAADGVMVLADNEPSPPTLLGRFGIRTDSAYGNIDDDAVVVGTTEPINVGELSPPRGVPESASGAGDSSGGGVYAAASRGSCNLNLTDVVSSTSFSGEGLSADVADPSSTSTMTFEAGPLQAAIAGVLGSLGSTSSPRSQDQDSQTLQQQHMVSDAEGGGAHSTGGSGGGGGTLASTLAATTPKDAIPQHVNPKDMDSRGPFPMSNGEGAESVAATVSMGTGGTPSSLADSGRQVQLQPQAVAPNAGDEALSTGLPEPVSTPGAPGAAPSAAEDATEPAGNAAVPLAESLSVTDLVKRAEQLRVAAMTAAGLELAIYSPAPASPTLISWGSSPAAQYTAAVLHSPSTPFSALHFTPVSFHFPENMTFHQILQQQQQQQQGSQQQRQQQQQNQPLRPSHSSPSALSHDALCPSSSCCTTPTHATTNASRTATAPVASGGASNNVAVARHVSRLPGSAGANSVARRRTGSNGGGAGGGYAARTPSPPAHALARRASASHAAAPAAASKAANSGFQSGDFVFPRLYVDGALTAAGIRAQNLGNTSGGGGGGGVRQRPQPPAAVPPQHHHQQPQATGRNKQGNGNTGGGGKGGGAARGSAGSMVRPAAGVMHDGRHEEEMEIPHEIPLAGGLDPSPVGPAAAGANLRRVLAPALAGAADALATGPSVAETRYSVWSLADALNMALGKAVEAQTREVEAAGAQGSTMGSEARDRSGGSARGSQGGAMMEEDGAGATRGAGRTRQPQDPSAAAAAASGAGASMSTGVGQSAGMGTTNLPSSGPEAAEEAAASRKQHCGVDGGGAVDADGGASLVALHDLIRQMAEL